MPDSSTDSITVAAVPGDVMAVIAGFADYPRWADAIKEVTVTNPGTDGYAARVRFSMDAGLIQDTYELAYTWAPDGLSVSWDLVSGTIQKAQHGEYRLRPLRGMGDPDGPATEVTYTLTVELAIPLIGALRRKAERTIMATALTELRAHVEGRR